MNNQAFILDENKYDDFMKEMKNHTAGQVIDRVTHHAGDEFKINANTEKLWTMRDCTEEWINNGEWLKEHDIELLKDFLNWYDHIDMYDGCEGCGFDNDCPGFAECFNTVIRKYLEQKND